MKAHANARNDGRRFEDLLERVLAQYEGAGFMRVRKVDPPTKVFGGRVVFLENPFPDFVGVWKEAAGRMVAFEAKSTLEPRLEAGGARGLTKKQLDALGEWGANGAVVFVLWELRGAVKLIPPVRLRRFCHEITEAKGPRSFRWDEPDLLPVPQGKGWVIADFRAVMRDLWGFLIGPGGG